MDVMRAADDYARQAAAGNLPGVIHLEVGQPSTGAPRLVREAAVAALDEQVLGYTVATGVPALRARIAAAYADWAGLAVDPDRIVVTAGASAGVVLAGLAAFDAGDRVAIASPGYPCYRHVLTALGVEVVDVLTDASTRFHPTPEALDEVGPLDGVVVASPSNPTGAVLGHDEVRALAGWCDEHGATLVSDEIYHGLAFGGVVPSSALAHGDDAIVVNSFSKYFSMAGWRLGWVVVPREEASRAVAYMGAYFLTAPSLAQHAALVAMDCTDELQGHVETYRRNRELLLEALPALGLEKIAPPDGAFYIYADVGALTDDSLAFCKQLLQDTGVATAPGVDFDPVDGRRFIRLSFAVSTPQVEDAIARLIPWFAAARAKAA
jgi:aspartate/methionine/tyrosine aminotransferase